MAKIDKISTCILDLPTIRGHVLSMATMVQQSIVLVEIKFSDGSVGLGEGTTIGGLSYGAESPESIQSAIDTYMTPLLLGRDGDNINAAMCQIDRAVCGNSIARCAVETALWDGLGKRQNMSVAQLFGGVVHRAMPVAWTLASGNSSTDIEEAQEMIEIGRHNIFKLKIGKGSVRQDIAHVAAITHAVGDRASIRVDVNQAWSLTDARWGIAGLEDIGVDLVEQPVVGTAVAALRSLTNNHKIAIMADEALQGPQTALACVDAADVFAIKIAQSGGLQRAREVISIAQAGGVGLYAGTMLEAGVGTAAALQLFATVPDLAWGGELFGPLLFTDEILQTPIEYRDFCVHLPDGHGIGATLDQDKVAFYQRGRSAKV